jgi:hypothetical protein
LNQTLSPNEARVDDPARFAFVTLGSFSGINAALGPLLAEAFADLELDHLDVRSWVRRNRALMTATSRGP